MDALLWIGALTVAAGLGATTVGVARRVTTEGGGALDAILEDSPDLYRAELARPFVARLLGPAWDRFERFAGAVTPSWWVERLHRNAALAGLGRWGIEGVLGMKGAFAAGGALLLFLIPGLVGGGIGGAVLWAVIGGVTGFFAPDIWMAHRAEKRQDAVRGDLPETLDLMAIAVQAGMGLEQAMELVSRRLPGPLGEEFGRTLREIQLGASRREALHHLRERTEVPELSTFALALAQADALGAPISEVLRVQAGEMRMLRRQRAREKAAKVPVKLLFPLLIGIFPALGIVIMGPAVIRIIEVFSG